MGLFDLLLPSVQEAYLSTQSDIDSRISPKPLIKQLSHSSSMKKFIKNLNKPTGNQLKIVRRLHVCNLLLLYWDGFAQVFLEEVKVPGTGDQWLDEEVVGPYGRFLGKCAMEYERYGEVMRCMIREDKIFDQLFFIINLIKMLFKATSKLSLLGKFYKPKHPTLYQSFVQMLALQAKQLYFPLKSILITILTNTQRYLFTSQHEQIMKNILMGDLAEINEEMKLLLLGKEFFPYGKAIGIKLFRVDEATTELEHTMRGIVTDHCETNRRIQKEEIQDKLFGKGFNVKFFEETLAGTTGKSAPFIGAFGKKNPAKKSLSQQVVISDDEDPQSTHNHGKILAETNQSNMNKQQPVQI